MTEPRPTARSREGFSLLWVGTIVSYMENFTHALCERLRRVALDLPEVTEGTSCVNRAFKVRKKNFVFVGEPADGIRIMVKLSSSLEAAKAMSDPRVDVGATGWVTIRFRPEEPLDQDLLGAWVLESYRSLAPKTLVRQLPE